MLPTNKQTKLTCDLRNWVSSIFFPQNKQINKQTDIINRQTTRNTQTSVTWNVRDRVSPAFFPPNQDGLVTVKDLPLPVTSASQNSRPVMEKPNSMTMVKLGRSAVRGISRVYASQMGRSLRKLLQVGKGDFVGVVVVVVVAYISRKERMALAVYAP